MFIVYKCMIYVLRDFFTRHRKYQKILTTCVFFYMQLVFVVYQCMIYLLRYFCTRYRKYEKILDNIFIKYVRAYMYVVCFFLNCMLLLFCSLPVYDLRATRSYVTFARDIVNIGIFWLIWRGPPQKSSRTLRLYPSYFRTVRTNYFEMQH